MQKKKTKIDSKDRIALVTGTTSSMGRKVVAGLLERGYEVRAILKTNPDKTSEWRDLPAGVRVYAADISLSDNDTKGVLRDACNGVSLMFHLAAITSNVTSNYNEIINTNVVGTENVVEAYLSANPSAERLKLVYSSSVTVYGYKRTGEILTEDSKTMPKSAYSESKYMAEQIIRTFAASDRRLDYTIFRIGVIYGKGYEQSFMRIFGLIKRGKLMYVGNGMNHLTLVNIDDVVAAFFTAMDSGRGSNRLYNLTDGVAYTQRELFDKAAKFLNAESPKRSIHPILARIGARTRGINMDQFRFLVSDRTVSIERIRKELGFRPSVKLDEAGRELAKEFLKLHKG